jgi:drug/metabolite transporter (DMT)-like permease
VTATSPFSATRSHAGRTDSPVKAVILANVAVLVFTLMDGVIKNVSHVFPTGELLFFRNFFACPVILGFMLATGGLRLATRRWLGHLLRGLFGVGAMYCFFLSYKLLPLSDAIALGLSGPIFLTVLSIPILGEKVGIRRWSAVIVGFLGVLLMTRPGAGTLQIAAFVPLGAAVFYALAMITIRRLSESEPSTTIVFYFTLFATLIALMTTQLSTLGPEYEWVWPTGWEWGSVLLIGFMGGVGQLVITYAFRMAPVSLIAPFDYTALVYAFIIGHLWFGEVPDAYLIVGGLLVVLSGIYIIHRETVVARQQRRKPPAPVQPTDA